MVERQRWSGFSPLQSPFRGCKLPVFFFPSEEPYSWELFHLNSHFSGWSGCSVVDIPPFEPRIFGVLSFFLFLVLEVVSFYCHIAHSCEVILHSFRDPFAPTCAIGDPLGLFTKLTCDAPL